MLRCFDIADSHSFFLTTRRKYIYIGAQVGPSCKNSSFSYTKNKRENKRERHLDTRNRYFGMSAIDSRNIYI